MTCVFHDYVVGGDAVGGYEEESLGVDLVDFADFATGDLLEPMFFDCIVLVVEVLWECSSCSTKLFATLVDCQSTTLRLTCRTLWINLGHYCWDIGHLE